MGRKKNPIDNASTTDTSSDSQPMPITAAESEIFGDPSIDQAPLITEVPAPMPDPIAMAPIAEVEPVFIPNAPVVSTATEQATETQVFGTSAQEVTTQNTQSTVNIPVDVWMQVQQDIAALKGNQLRGSDGAIDPLAPKSNVYDIKATMYPVVQKDGSFKEYLVTDMVRKQSMVNGKEYLHESWDEMAEINGQPQRVSVVMLELTDPETGEKQEPIKIKHSDWINQAIAYKVSAKRSAPIVVDMTPSESEVEYTNRDLTNGRPQGTGIMVRNSVQGTKHVFDVTIQGRPYTLNESVINVKQ